MIFEEFICTYSLFFFSESRLSNRLLFGLLGELSMIPSSQMTMSSSMRTSHDLRFSRFLNNPNIDFRRFWPFDPIGAIDTVELIELIDEFRSPSLNVAVDESEDLIDKKTVFPSRNKKPSYSA